MSHSVKVTLIADQCIELLGNDINIHDLEHIVLDSNGQIIDFRLSMLGCPFCGDIESLCVVGSMIESRFYVRCKICEMTGPADGKSSTEARQLWNLREGK